MAIQKIIYEFCVEMHRETGGCPKEIYLHYETFDALIQEGKALRAYHNHEDMAPRDFYSLILNTPGGQVSIRSETKQEVVNRKLSHLENMADAFAKCVQTLKKDAKE